jgi:uncharacterized protein (TIGR03435 family)
MRWIGKTAITLLASTALIAQTRPEFEVASIKPSPPIPPGQMNLGIRIDGAQFHSSYFSLKDYIRIAYKLKDYQVVGPDWISSERYEINAKLPAGATREQTNDMLQALLAERFQLKAHTGSKEFSVYALVVAKNGLTMKEAVPTETSGETNVDVRASGSARGVSVNLGKGASFSLADNKFEAKKLNMQQLAESLARFVERPVIDMTGAKGVYDLSLEFAPEDYRVLLIHSAVAAGVALPPGAMQLLEGTSDAALLTAVQTLGLRLEPRKAPLETLVIDHVVKAPLDN